MERDTSKFSVVLFAFEFALSKMNSHLPTVHSFSLKKTVYMSEKILLDRNIVQITSTSIKGRHSIHREMNAESFENSYFPQTETVFVVQFF